VMMMMMTMMTMMMIVTEMGRPPWPRSVVAYRSATLFEGELPRSLVACECMQRAAPSQPSRGRGAWPRGDELRVRVEIMGPAKYENAGKSQSVLIMINPIISTRTRTQGVSSPHRPMGGGGCAHSGAWESHAAVPRVYTICRILNFVWVCLLMACRITARDGQRQSTQVCQPAVALAALAASRVSQSVSGCVSWQGQLWVPFWLDCCAGLSTIPAILYYKHVDRSFWIG
jgi:hypothetical protein